MFGLYSSLAVYDITPAVVFEAARAVREHGLSYWDAQVWAAAKLNQIPIVLTEDIPGKDRIEVVRFLNPFSASFDISVLQG